MTRIKRALLVVCFLSVTASADNSAVVHGELHDAPQPVDRLTVYLVSLDRSFHVERTAVNGDGTFQFRSVLSGAYTLEVRDGNGETIRQQTITVAGPATEMSLYLGQSNKTPAVPSGSPTVSVKQLLHDPDGRATHEFNTGEDLLLRKDYPKARKHFVKALKIDPDYADAHAELGVIAFRSGQADEAEQELERAVKLDPMHFIAWGNLATLHFQRKEYEVAERYARRGLEASPHDPKLHFLVGSSRFSRGQYDGDTDAHLEEASHGYPNAHIVLAESLLRTGDAVRARPHIKAALASTNEAIRARAQFLMSVLEKPVKEKSAQAVSASSQCAICAPLAAAH